MLSVTITKVPTNVIDFSQVDLMAGIVIGAVVVLVVLSMIGFFLIKYRIVYIRKPNGDIIKPPQFDIDGFCSKHSGVTKSLEVLEDKVDKGFTYVWTEIKEVNKRQIDLRQKLPEQYVSKVDLSEMHNRLRDIDNKLDKFMEIVLMGKKV
jgi:tetrahydromethanopterin S-methyltransferase subunit G